jgi:anti-sigma regulatory factor (Ser/Thr protein kinase)
VDSGGKGGEMTSHDYVPATPAEARAWIRTLMPENSHDAELVLSELVTNAVMHGTGPVRCTATIDVDAITLQVSQPAGSAVHIPRDADGDAIGGRGLSIVDAVSETWGTRFDGAYFTAWATLPIH